MDSDLESKTTKKQIHLTGYGVIVICSLQYLLNLEQFVS